MLLEYNKKNHILSRFPVSLLHMQWKLFFAVHRFQTGSIRPVFGRELRLQPSEISMALMHCDGKIRRNWRKKLEVYIYISFAVYVCRIYFFQWSNFFIFNFVGPRKKVEKFEGLEILSFKMHTKKPQTSNSRQQIHDILDVDTSI